MGAISSLHSAVGFGMSDSRHLFSLSPPIAKHADGANSEEEEGARFGDGSNRGVTQRKIDLKNCWPAAALAIHQLKREVPRRSRISYRRSCGRRGTRVEPQIESTD